MPKQKLENFIDKNDDRTLAWHNEKMYKRQKAKEKTLRKQLIEAGVIQANSKNDLNIIVTPPKPKEEKQREFGKGPRGPHQVHNLLGCRNKQCTYTVIDYFLLKYRHGRCPKCNNYLEIIRLPAKEVKNAESAS